MGPQIQQGKLCLESTENSSAIHKPHSESRMSIANFQNSVKHKKVTAKTNGFTLVGFKESN